jgi:hypothetical protein
MPATSRASNESLMYESAAEAASPASFHPLNAHTRTGARSSGRSRQITSVIGFTVLGQAPGGARCAATLFIDASDPAIRIYA